MSDFQSFQQENARGGFRKGLPKGANSDFAGRDPLQNASLQFVLREAALGPGCATGILATCYADKYRLRHLGMVLAPHISEDRFRHEIA